MRVFEQAAQKGGIATPIRLGPNAFASIDVPGAGKLVRSRIGISDTERLAFAVDERGAVAYAVGVAQDELGFCSEKRLP